MSPKHSQRLRHRSTRRLQLENLELRAVMFAGDLDIEFAAGGLLRLPALYSASDSITPYLDNAANGIYVQDHLNPTGSVQRFDLTGTVDPDFGLGGPISLTYDTTAVQSTGHVVVMDSTRPPDEFVVSTTTSTTTNPTSASVPSTFGLVEGMAVNDVVNGIDYGFIVSIDRVNNNIELSQDAPLDGTTDLTYTGLTRGFDASLSRFDSFGDQDFGFGTTGIFGATNLDFSSEITYGADLPVQRITEDNLPIAIKVESGTDKLWVLTGGDLKLTASSEYRPSHYFGLARLNATGTPDNSFSQNGLFIHEFPPVQIGVSETEIHSFVPTDLVLTQDGGALVVGFETVFNTATFSNISTVVAVRISSTGELVTGFGTAGKLTLSSIGQVADAGKVRAALDPSTGKFVLGFYHPTGNPSEFELQLVRVSPTGVLDTTYGTNGVISTGHLETVTGFTAMDEFGLAVQKTDEKTVIAMGNPTWIVRRYTRTGTPDASFGTNGEVITQLSANSADIAIPTDLDIQFDGKIVVTGAFLPQTGGQEIVVARYVPQDIGNTDALSSVLTLPSDVFTNQFTVSWSGTASAGIKNYDIWYVIDGGTPVLWQPATTATSAVFNLPVARRHTVGFFSIAHDNNDAQEAAAGIDASTNYVGAPWQNPVDQFDVVPSANGTNGNVGITDILSVIFEFNNRLISNANNFQVILPPVVAYLNGPYPDVNGDNLINITDILTVIFRFNQQNGNGEGESIASEEMLVLADSSSESSFPAADLAYLVGYDFANRRNP